MMDRTGIRKGKIMIRALIAAAALALGGGAFAQGITDTQVVLG